MGQKYGSRWEIVKHLGQGGQGDVFEVKDISSSADKTLMALKRVKNPNRHARFQQEVNAIKTLDHPNVIKIVDHSALDVEGNAPEKQYIVMPLAHGGDLSKRAALYKGNLDGVLIVAKQIASALDHAHSKGIVHRDVKPQNILFPEQSNQIWLTDFGICFFRSAERPTEDGEVVGPWSFMAPELEHGGKLDVTPAADIYSLGKVIYYMISGGVVVPREEMFSSQYVGVFSAAGRYELLVLLLRKMVCAVDARLKNMSDVITGLDRIIEWDRNSTLTPVALETRSKLEMMRASVLQSRDTASKNLANVQAQRETETRIQSHFMDWLRSELEKTATEVGDGDVIATSVQVVNPEDHKNIRLADINVLSGMELLVSNVSTRANWIHVLQIFFCTEFTITMQSGHSNEPEPVVPPKDRTIHIFPIYSFRRTDQNTMLQGLKSQFFFSVSGQLIPLPNPTARNGANNVRHVTQSARLVNSFPFSSWPAGEYTMREFLGVCVHRFIENIDRYKNDIFPPSR